MVVIWSLGKKDHSFLPAFKTGRESYPLIRLLNSCVLVMESIAHSGPSSWAAPLISLRLLCSIEILYGGSVAVRFATFRRSRFCTYETCSVFRCPFVLCQVHYLPYIEESVGLPNFITACFPQLSTLRLFRCRHLRHGLTDVRTIMRELGFSNWPASPCTQDLQGHDIHAFSHALLFRHAVFPFTFRCQVGRLS